MDWAENTRQRTGNLFWAFLSILLAVSAMRDALVFRDIQGVVYFALHLQAAILFLVRHDEVARSPHPFAYLVAGLSTLYVYVYDLNLNPELAGIWHPLGPSLTFVGSLFCFAATWSLGKYYGVLPICRGVRMNFAYRFVRHPIYASYIIMDIGIVLAFPSVKNIGIFLIAVALFLFRIRYEEEAMGYFSTYGEYCQKVKFRLIPKVY